jgi:hypothetical protein
MAFGQPQTHELARQGASPPGARTGRDRLAEHPAPGRPLGAVPPSRRHCRAGQRIEHDDDSCQLSGGGLAAHHAEHRRLLLSLLLAWIVLPGRLQHCQPFDLPTPMPNWRCTLAQNASRSHSLASW